MNQAKCSFGCRANLGLAIILTCAAATRAAEPAAIRVAMKPMFTLRVISVANASSEF